MSTRRPKLAPLHKIRCPHKIPFHSRDGEHSWTCEMNPRIICRDECVVAPMEVRQELKNK